MGLDAAHLRRFFRRVLTIEGSYAAAGESAEGDVGGIGDGGSCLFY